MRSAIISAAVLYCGIAGAQEHISINSCIRLPRDTSERRILLTALDRFISHAEQRADSNLWAKEGAETAVLLDEIVGIRQLKSKTDSVGFSPYLENITPYDKNNYLLQLTYLGFRRDTLMRRATFTILAARTGEGFRFSSPLQINTRNWKTLRSGTVTFHYRNDLNENKARGYIQLVSRFDRKLGNNKRTEIFCAKGTIDALRLFGVDYKSDYNGWNEGSFSAADNTKKISVQADSSGHFDNFDPHDLWHERRAMVVPRSIVYRPVDEGIAYLYGGSWGYTWNEIYAAFRKDIASNRSTNWSDVKEKPVYFKTGEYSNAADYVVNALIVEKIEKEKGFAGVWELLNCGKAEKGNANYYAALEKITGITKENYNAEVWKMIDAGK